MNKRAFPSRRQCSTSILLIESTHTLTNQFHFKNFLLRLEKNAVLLSPSWLGLRPRTLNRRRSVTKSHSYKNQGERSKKGMPQKCLRISLQFVFEQHERVNSKLNKTPTLGFYKTDKHNEKLVSTVRDFCLWFSHRKQCEHELLKWPRVFLMTLAPCNNFHRMQNKLYDKIVTKISTSQNYKGALNSLNK